MGCRNGGSGVWWNATGRKPLFDMARNSSVTDTRLIRRSQQGDRRAFRALLTRHDWRLRGLAHALLLDPEHVDAVLRVAYVKAWREVVRINGRDDASGWLYRVVYNACIDGLRREGTRVGAPPPAAADAPGAGDAAGGAMQPPVQAAPAGGNGSNPGGSAQDRQARLVEALASLAPTDRVAVVLVDREGFSPGAAARILGLAPELLGARLAGARARLTEQLAQVIAAAPAPAAEAAAQADGVKAKTNRSQTKPEEPQAGEPQPERAQPEEPQAGEPPPERAQPEEPQAGEPPPERAQPEEPPAEDAEPEQSEPEEQAPADEPPPVDAPAPVAAAEPQAEASAEPKAEAAAQAEDSPPAEPEDTKVASRSAAGASPNGASGAARSNGSDDTGGGGA